LVRAELARMIRDDISDPALRAVAVSDVKLSNDLKSATVFYTSGEATLKPKDLKKGFERAIPYMRRKLGDKLELRYVPTLTFEQDTHNDDVMRLYSLLADVEKPA
jgi:ribosome-binding factor A